jgi:monoamine oxidase
LIGTGAAAAAAGALTRVPGAEARKKRKHKGPRKRHADVVVVGAGFAGLTAALRVAQAGKSVIVLEARDRVGGRSLNAAIPGGEVTERGAAFIGPTQDHIAKLASDFGVGTFATYDTGQNVYVRDGTRSTYSDTGPTGTAPLDPLILPDLTLVVTQLDQMATEVPVDAPWTAANAASWDAQTLGSWVESHSITPQFRELVPAATRPIFGAEPRELSLLFTLFYIAASGNEQNVGTFERNFNTRMGAQQDRFVGGTQLVALRVAERLGKKRVLLKHPVKQIVQKGGGVVVHTKRLRVRAKRVIVAVPPTLAGRIDYRPGMPPDRDQLTPADSAGNADEGDRRLRPAVLAGRRPDGHGRINGRLRQRHLRRHPSRRQPRRGLRVRRRRSGAGLQPALRFRPARGGARSVRSVLRVPRAQSDRLPGVELGG